MQRINPKFHKNLVRICNQFGIDIKDNKGEYKLLSKLMIQMKEKVGY